MQQEIDVPAAPAVLNSDFTMKDWREMSDYIDRDDCTTQHMSVRDEDGFCAACGCKPANLDFDNGTGYSTIMDDLSEKFGVVDFGWAGGNVNMIIDTESGHRINITDAGDCNLSDLYDHTPAIGYTVGVYDRAAWESGDDCNPIVLITGYVGVKELPRLIETALDAVRRGTCGHYYTKWGRACELEPGHTEERHRSCEISWTNEMATP